MTSVVMTGRRMNSSVKFMMPSPGAVARTLTWTFDALPQPQLAVGHHPFARARSRRSRRRDRRPSRSTLTGLVAAVLSGWTTKTIAALLAGDHGPGRHHERVLVDVEPQPDVHELARPERAVRRWETCP